MGQRDLMMVEKWLPDFSNNQGVINGRITQLVGNPEQLKAFMGDKTEKQKKAGRVHLHMVIFMRGRK